MRRSRGGIRTSHPGKSTSFLRKEQLDTPGKSWNPLDNIEPGPTPGEISLIHACRHVVDKHARVSLCVFSECVLYLVIKHVGHLMFVFTDQGQNN